MNAIIESRTLEQRLKFDYGLPVGLSLIWITHEGIKRKALVEITARGSVSMVAEPALDDMHAVWRIIKGDVSRELSKKHAVQVWPASKPDSEFMQMFSGIPVAEVPVVEK